jgi:hypothetical protein
MLRGVAERRGRSDFPQRERWEGKLRGIDDFEGLAFIGIDELVVDEQASSIEISTKEARVGEELGIYGCWYDLPFGS